MSATLFTAISSIVTLGRTPSARVSTADRLQTLALQRRLDRYV
jgi:hypothetical protein